MSSEEKFDPKTQRSRRQHERAHVLNRLKGVFLRCSQFTHPEVRVVNISETGLGIENKYLTPPIKALKTINAQLLVGKTISSISLKLVRIHGDIAGFEFIHPNALLQAAIRVYFDAELVGANLKPTGTDQSTNTSPTLIYKDKKSNALSLEIRQNRIHKIKIELFGNLIEWQEGKEFLQALGPFLRKQLIQMIQNTEALEQIYKKQLKKILLGIKDTQ